MYRYGDSCDRHRRLEHNTGINMISSLHTATRTTKIIKMKVKVKSKKTGDKYVLTPENLLEVFLLEGLTEVFNKYKDRDLQVLISKLLDR